jgi:two-component system, OmpR family, alkaline phosphatase synthesis response regulator PhoP
MSRILVVEDEAHLADGLRFNFTADGHDVLVAATGEAALRAILVERKAFDAVVLDVMLPGKDGFTVASELRAAGEFVPILMLTSRGRPEDVLRGFEAGADDYLPKPFDLKILMARVGGLLRRTNWNAQDTPVPVAPVEAREDDAGGAYTFAGRTLDFDAMEIRVGDKTFRLTLMETNLLRYLVRNAGVAVSRKAILEQVWGLDESTDTRAIDNFIVRLRRYVEDRPAAPKFLQTVRGVGYRFVPDTAPTPTPAATR